MARSTPSAPADPAGGNGAGETAGLGERVNSLGRAAQSFREELRGTAADLGRMLDINGRVQRHPYAMMAVAVGVGYLLGGGLFTRTTARLLGLAGRIAGLPYMRSEIAGIAEAILSAREGEPPAPPPTSGIPSPS